MRINENEIAIYTPCSRTVLYSFH